MRKKRKIWESNRDVSRQPRRGKYWCDNCDAQLVSCGKKCSNCGYKPLHKRNKK